MNWITACGKGTSSGATKPDLDGSGSFPVGRQGGLHPLEIDSDRIEV